MADPGYPLDLVEPDITDIVTEDDEPVDNFASEKQQRLLTEPLYTSWSGPPPDPEPRPFVAAANVGVFVAVKDPPLVPDALLSIDVEVHPDFWEKRHRSYFIWEMGKAPDVAIEIVSNREGGELTTKKRRYAAMRIAYYVVWDPSQQLGCERLQAFELRGDLYVPMSRPWFDSIGLGLTKWTGTFEGIEAEWLRWHKGDEALLRTGAERAESEKQRAEQAEGQVDKLLKQLREAGLEPENG